MDWKAASRTEQGLVKIPKRWLQLHYYEALNILFRFENSLRVFVYIVLKNAFAEKWKECAITTPTGEQLTIQGLASRRASQAKNFGYLGFDIRAPLMHLTSGELVDLMTADAYWPKFRAFFRGQQEIIKNKLLEIGSIRNSLAHFRPIKPDDVDVVKQNSRHTLLGVEECLVNAFNQDRRVPTNTDDAWYKAISTLGTDLVTTTLHYSGDESWVNVRLKYSTPILGKEQFGEKYLSFTLAKLNTPNILQAHKCIATAITYLSESSTYPSLSKERDIEVSKSINFVFRKEAIVEKHAEIAAEFAAILRKIEEECDLLQKDNLARGSVIETASGYSYWSEPEQEAKVGRWNHHYADLSRAYQSNDPDEYWGEHQFTKDLVGGCRRYPWMPGDISDPEGIFDEI